MSGSNVVYQGAVAPEAFRMRIVSGQSGIDLTTVTSVEFRVRPPVGDVMVWAAAIQPGATAGVLVAVHTYDVGDTARTGRHQVQAYLYVPAGRVRSNPGSFVVVDPLAAGA